MTTTNTSSKNKTNSTHKPQPPRPAPPAPARKGPTPTQPADHIKIGLDVGLRKYALARQVDGSLHEPPHLKSPDDFRTWVLTQKPLANKVTVCYEAGVFGFELARWLIGQGIACIVMAPVGLDEKGSRVETDKLNARDILSRLDRYLAGNTRALTPCRIPTREEELARHQTRQREQLRDHRNRLDAQGRSLLWQFGYLQFNSRWWKSPTWEALPPHVAPEILAELEPLRVVILELNTQIAQREKQLRAQVPTALPAPLQSLPVGVGWLTLLILTREIMDWKRFTNRRQVSCFTGLVPSESSTGESCRQGSVTKVGNPRVRTVLVEMMWRLVRYQPDCHALKKWRPILTDPRASRAARKKAIVAAARQMSVDLWRLATGQTTCEKLGLQVRLTVPALQRTGRTAAAR